MEEKFNPLSSQLDRTKEASAIKEGKKNQIFDTLVELIAQKKKEDPKFKLTGKTLNALVKENLNIFRDQFGITSGHSILAYWSNEMVYLREKIDAAIKESKS